MELISRIMGQVVSEPGLHDLVSRSLDPATQDVSSHERARGQAQLQTVHRYWFAQILCRSTSLVACREGVTLRSVLVSLKVPRKIHGIHHMHCPKPGGYRLYSQFIRN